MEFAEILALIKKAIFLVGGACVLILLYYRFVKTDKKIIEEPPKEEERPKESEDPMVNVRQCNIIDDTPSIFRNPDDIIDIDPSESEWIEKEQDPFGDIFNESLPQERKNKLIAELKEMGYTQPPADTDMNADPFED